MVDFLRVTRQGVEALGPGDGQTRVTRQYVEVLGTSLSPDVFTQIEFEQIVTRNPSVAVTREYLEILGVNAGQARVTRSYVEALCEIIVFEPDTVIGFQNDFVVNVVRNVAVGTSIAFTQQDEVGNPEYPDTESLIDFTDTAYGNVPIKNVFATSYIQFQMGTGRIREVSVTTTIDFDDGGDWLGVGETNITFVQTVNASYGLYSTIEFAQEAEFNVTFTRPVTTGIGFITGVIAYVEGPNLLCDYTPFIGGSTGFEIPAPPATPPTLGTATLTLTYPYDTPTETLVLRNPEFSNRDQLDFTRIRRQTRGGHPITFSDRKWPKQQILNFDLSALTEAQSQDLLDFANQSLGQEIGLLDHENRQWRGLLLNVDTDVTDGGPACTYSARVQFEGVLE